MIATAQSALRYRWLKRQAFFLDGDADFPWKDQFSGGGIKKFDFLLHHMQMSDIM